MTVEARLAATLMSFLGSLGYRLATDMGEVEIHDDGTLSLRRTRGSAPEVYTVTISVYRARF